MVEEREIIKRTIRTTMNFLIQLNIHSLDEISPKIINKIISKFIHESSKSVTYRIRHLKQFFTFCFDNNLCRNDISSIIPHVTIPHAVYLPASWSADEARQLLDSLSIEPVQPAKEIMQYCLLHVVLDYAPVIFVDCSLKISTGKPRKSI